MFGFAALDRTGDDMRKFLAGLTGFLFLATFLPVFRMHYRWVRIWDFPRLQLASLALADLALLALLGPHLRAGPRRLLGLTNLVCLAYQLRRVYPYTPVHRNEAVKSRRRNRDAVFSFMISNVQMSNRVSRPFLDLVRKADPDLLLINEPDRWWEERLRELDGAYPWRVKVPQDNTYGMIFYSRLRLVESQVLFLVRDYVPSIRAVAEIPSGQRIEVHCVHPEPPSEAHTHFRDAELLVVGRRVAEADYPCIVAGDLNDVAWSSTTRLFQKISRMVDPRIGRGFYNTFNAKMPLLRYSLDHIFYSPSFSLVHLEKLPAFGSDHFPILVRLEYDPGAKRAQSPPPKHRNDVKRARHVIRMGREMDEGWSLSREYPEIL